MAVKKSKSIKQVEQSELSPKEEIQDNQNDSPRLVTEEVIEESDDHVSQESDIEQSKKEEVLQEPVSTVDVEDSPPTPQTVLEKEEMEKEVITELFTKNDIGYPQISSHTRSSSRTLLLWAIVVIATSVVTGVGLLLARGTIRLPALTTPTPTPAPTIIPTPTVSTVDLKREDITIEVLNGGGVPGAAGKMKTFLEEKGYTVSSTGNTDEYTYAETEIVVKSQMESYIPLIKEDLKDAYVIGSVQANLSSDAPADVRIIVGKK